MDQHEGKGFQRQSLGKQMGEFFISHPKTTGRSRKWDIPVGKSQRERKVGTGSY
jgi:hypothetical protein